MVTMVEQTKETPAKAKSIKRKSKGKRCDNIGQVS